MIKCIIVEDERLAQQVIQSHLQKTDRCELVGICSNTAEAKELLGKNDIDLMFLDIQLPGMTGLDFLRTLEDPPLVILTTAYPEYALESYEYNVVDYLLKPISLERFSKAINKIIDGKLFTGTPPEKEPLPGDHIFIKSNSKFFRIDFNDIIYIEGMKDYLKIHTTNNTLVTHQTMQEMEQLLPARQFIRIHKSYIVAISHIESVFGNSIEMKKATLPVGTSYKESITRLIGRK